jgi:hypothetical protein
MGGAILLASGSMKLNGNTIGGNVAVGGAGGVGGAGALGGMGGNGGAGAAGGLGAMGGAGGGGGAFGGYGNQAGNGGKGGNGGDGGDGGGGGKGGAGGAGGSADGGGLAVLGGTVTSVGDAFTSNKATGGAGGGGGRGAAGKVGGNGGAGATGGNGGNGGRGGSGTLGGGAGGNGGNAGAGGTGGVGGNRGNGGMGGNGGAGGAAKGGSIYVAAGQVTLGTGSTSKGAVTAGAGGLFGAGGNAGTSGGPGGAGGIAGGAGLGGQGGAVGGAAGNNGNARAGGAAGATGNPGSAGAAGGIGLAGSTSGKNNSGNVLTGPGDVLVFSTEPADAKAGRTLAPVVVMIENNSGTLQTSDNSAVTIGIESGPAGASLLGTLTVNAVGGVATFSDLAIQTAGSYTLTAGDLADSLAAGTFNSTSFNINPRAASKLLFVQPPTKVTAGAAISPAITVEVADKFGNLVSSNSSTVSLSVSSGPAGGVVSGAPSQAAMNGLATFSGVVLDTAGTYSLQAGDGSLTGATSPSFKVVPAAASKIHFSTQPPAKTTAGVALAPFAVTLKDAFGNVAAKNSSTVTLSINTGPDGATLSGTFTAAISDGVATFNDVILDAAGEYTLTATDGSLSVISDQFKIKAAAGA